MSDTHNFRRKILPGLNNAIFFLSLLRKPKSTKHLCPFNKNSKYKNQKLVELQGEIHKPTTIVGDFNITLT